MKGVANTGQAPEKNVAEHKAASLSHSLTLSLIDSLTHSLTHSLTISLSHSVTHITHITPLTHSLTNHQGGSQQIGQLSARYGV